MKTQKHRIILAVIIFCVLLFAVGCLAVYLILLTTQREIIQTAHSYQPYSMASADGKYVLQTEKIEEKEGVSASFSITSADTMVYKCPDKYRTMDLKSIAWDKNSLDVVVQSKDVGNYRYVYENGNWAKELDGADMVIKG